MNKKAQQNKDQSGILQSPTGINERNRYRELFEKEKVEGEAPSLYGVFKESENSEVNIVYPKHTLSTRYAPDMPGVQARRVGDAHYQNPITGSDFNYGEGFSVGDVNYPAYDISMQTSLYSLANKLEAEGLNKYAKKVLNLIKWYVKKNS